VVHGRLSDVQKQESTARRSCRDPRLGLVHNFTGSEVLGLSNRLRPRGTQVVGAQVEALKLARLNVLKYL
jgi:hypothetical protein